MHRSTSFSLLLLLSQPQLLSLLPSFPLPSLPLLLVLVQALLTVGLTTNPPTTVVASLVAFTSL